MAGNSEKQTLVEEGTEFKGTLTARCKVVVKGTVDGDLDAPALEIAQSGTVTGNVKAGSVRSAGVLAGIVEADDIALAGQVRSDTVIRAKSLEIKLASEKGRLEVTFGDCVMEVGESPAAAAADGAKRDAKTKAPDPSEVVAAAPPVEEEATKKRKRGEPAGVAGASRPQ